MNRENKRNIIVLIFQAIAIIFHSICSILWNFRIPNVTPLSDVGQQMFPYNPDLFTYSEIFSSIQMIIFFTILFFRIDRMIILRRFFILFSLLLFLRPVFYLCTQVPHANEYMVCDYGIHIDSKKECFFNIILKIVYKAMENIVNFRMITKLNSQEDCFENFMSLQTVMVLLVYNFILKYSIGDSDRKRENEEESWGRYIMKGSYWLITALASCGGLFSQLNYSMDIVLSFFITNQLFAMYHTMCFPGIDYREKVQTNPLDDHSNEMQNFWWWPLFEYVELND